MQHVEAVSRELAIQLLKREGIDLYDGGLGNTALGSLTNKTESLSDDDKQFALAEAMTKMCMYSLKLMSPLYPEFEDELWSAFSKMGDLESQMLSFGDLVRRTSYATAQYYAFLQGMFAKSGKTRHQFYQDMLAEAGIEIGFDSIEFGQTAIAFKKQAVASVHGEHLLVFYSVELFLRVYISLHPRDSPLADGNVEVFYRHFEAAIPLALKFERYTKDEGLFKFSASHKILPSIN